MPHHHRYSSHWSKSLKSHTKLLVSAYNAKEWEYCEIFLKLNLNIIVYDRHVFNQIIFLKN